MVEMSERVRPCGANKWKFFYLYARASIGVKIHRTKRTYMTLGCATFRESVQRVAPAIFFYSLLENPA